jgi:outer membrane protein assembly factor BamB
MRHRCRLSRNVFGAALILIAAGASTRAGRAMEANPLVLAITETYRVPGGLVVQVGGEPAVVANDLVGTGQFLVQLLVANRDSLGPLRETLQAQGRYGLATADALPAPRTLPFAENLVNVLVLGQQPDPSLPLAEIVRVLCPRGVLLEADPGITEDALRSAGFEAAQVIKAGGTNWVAARKRWPVEMDGWSHPRHAADGNAVSQDVLVGPPRRVRWVAGPAAEVSSVVSAQGRNYYGGVWTRDAFNGLRLWQRDLKPSPAQGGFGFSKAAGSVRPIAGGDELFVWTAGVVTALDGATGRTLRTYPEAGTPSELLRVGDAILAVDGQSLRALDVATGNLRWKYETSEPRYVVASDAAVFLLEGSPRRGEKPTAVSLDLASGGVRWKQNDYPWLPLVRRTVCRRDYLALEVSTLADEKQGNALHVVSAADGRLLWSRTFVPSMNHMKQARAMFVGDRLWVLEDLKCVGLDAKTGEVKESWKAGLCHCFPPVATTRFMFSGEMELTDLATGQYDAQRITKAACGRDAGWMPANGLIYVTPKHCVCWPMLRGYVAMAPAASAGESASAPAGASSAPPPVLEKGDAGPPENAVAGQDDWPCYRHDAIRSSGTSSVVPTDLKVLWQVGLGGRPEGTLVDDWRENPFVCGPITAPVAGSGLVCVARSDAHQVVAIDAGSGQVRWRHTANGRIDTAPTLHHGLCLFGTANGWVYALRADDGRLVWRLRAAPHEERMVAYGQIESPWPVAGSVLVVDGVAYFAAGRHSLADGGIRVFAVEPVSGQTRWQQRLTSVPQTSFYACNALEFDHIDLLHQEADAVAMSRWLFRRDTGAMTCLAAEAFAIFKTDSLGVAVPRGCWTYAPRHQPRHGGDASPVRPLVAFRGHTLIGCLDDLRTVYRRDFDLAGSGQFDTKWITGWAAGENFSKKKGETWRSERLSKNGQWSAAVFSADQPQQKIAALALAGDQILAAGSMGGLQILSWADGKTLAQLELPAPVWDGLAVAGGRVYVATQAGDLICLGK